MSSKITCCLIDGTDYVDEAAIRRATTQLLTAREIVSPINEIVWLSYESIPPHLQSKYIQYIAIPQLSYKSYQSFSIMNLPDICKQDFLLTCQLDGVPYAPESWQEQFLEYDYIGALLEPNVLQNALRMWGVDKHILDKDCYWCCNSGFCLRSKRLLMRARELKLHQKYGSIYVHDDVYIGVIIRDVLDSMNFVFPPTQLVHKFAIDFRPPRDPNPVGHVYDGRTIHTITRSELKKYRPFGIHGIYLQEEDLPCH